MPSSDLLWFDYKFQESKKMIYGVFGGESPTSYGTQQNDDDYAILITLKFDEMKMKCFFYFFSLLICSHHISIIQANISFDDLMNNN